MTHRTACLALCAALAACVPASEKRAPAGAVGYVTVPTPASRGVPFRTRDGWTVRVETLVLQAYLSARPSSYGYDDDGRNPGSYGETSSVFRWNAADAVELYVPGLSLQTQWIVTAQLRGLYAYEDRVTSYDVDDRSSLRLQPIKGPRDDFGGGAMLVVIAHGVRGDRAVTLDAALATKERGIEYTGVGYQNVEADALRASKVQVDAERLFEFSGQVTFDPVADADLDGDGRVTDAEAAAKRTPCIACADFDATLDQAMEINLGSVLRQDRGQP